MVYRMACVLDPTYSFQWLLHDHAGPSDVKQNIKDVIIECIIKEAETLHMGTTLQQPAANQDTSSLRTDDNSTETTSAGELNMPVPKKPRLFANYTRTKVQTTSVKSARILVQQYIEYAEELSMSGGEGSLSLWSKVKNNAELQSCMCCLKKIFCTPATSAPVERVFIVYEATLCSNGQ